jgi:hypothetical protein
MPFSTKSRQSFAHVVADPSRQVFHSPPPFGQLVVVPPSLDVVSPLVAQLLAGQALAGFPELLPVMIITGDFFKIISEDEG